MHEKSNYKKNYKPSNSNNFVNYKKFPQNFQKTHLQTKEQGERQCADQ
jgi:hypothetical protein